MMGIVMKIIFVFLNHILILLFLYQSSFAQKSSGLNNPGDTTIEKNIDSIATDVDGNRYQTIKIGKQVWLKQNLEVTHYRDGSQIPQVADEQKWSLLTNGGYCLGVKNPEEYKNRYGVLYNYYSVIDERGLCPKGWHVPSKEEWEQLENYLGGQQKAGNKLKDIKSTLWKTLQKQDEESGFDALPAGGRGRLGYPQDIGYYATWWASTSYDSLYAWHWGVHPDKNSIRKNPGHKNSGFSVRCIQD